MAGEGVPGEKGLRVRVQPQVVLEVQVLGPEEGLVQRLPEVEAVEVDVLLGR